MIVKSQSPLMILGLKLENSPWDGMKSEGKFSLLMKLENSPVIIMSRDWLHSQYLPSSMSLSKSTENFE